MRQFMKDFMEQMTSMQQSNLVNKPYGGDKNKAADGQTQVQMQQIGNVFYNLLNMVGS